MALLQKRILSVLKKHCGGRQGDEARCREHAGKEAFRQWVLALAAVSLLMVLLHNRQAVCLSLFPRPFTANTARMEGRGRL